MRALGIALSATIVACGDGRDAEDVRRVREDARTRRILEAECMRPAASRSCEASRRIDFGPSHESAIWCEDGIPHGRFVDIEDKKPVEGTIGQALWESIWRVIDVTDGCVWLYGSRPVVTRDGRETSCQSTEHDLTDRVRWAYYWARQKIPAVVKKRPPRTADPAGICAIDPSACPASAPGPRGTPVVDCPEYVGDE